MTAAVDSQPLRSGRSRERVELILSQLDRLPTLPAVAARLLAATTSNQSSMRDVVDIIESDASLTAAILRLVRRADLGVRGRGMTVPRAVGLLGFSAVRAATLSVQLYDTFARVDEHARIAATREGLWRHSLGVACAAEMIAERVGGSELAGEAFVCGLLHDVGKIALDACLPKSFARVVEGVERPNTCICDVEREVFGLDHTVAGRHLAARWRLPQSVVECVWLHHQSPDALPSSVLNGQLVRVVHLADDLVRQAGVGFSGYGHVGDVDHAAAALGVPPDGLTNLVGRLPERMEPFHDLLGLDDRRGRSEYAASLMAANRQLGQINARLAAESRHLEVRAACLDAVARFTRRLSDRDRLADVCVAAADAVREMLGGERAVAFFMDEMSGCTYVGRTPVGDDENGVTLVLDPSESWWASAGRSSLSLPSTTGLIAAAPSDRDWWRRCMGEDAAGLLWLLPLCPTNGSVGGVLVAASEPTVSRFQSSSTAWEAVSTAIGLAWVSARARVEADRTNDELLDLNRRLSAAQKELVRARSIAMIAKMAAGAAHELNNPLTVISGRAQLELDRCTDPDSARALRLIIEQAQRASQIVTDLMQFAKPKPPEPALTRLVDVIEPLCQHWRSTSSLREEQLTFTHVDRHVTVYADPAQLREILDAVLANAVQATRPETARVQVNSPSRASDETLRIVVEDNGVGMMPEVLEHAPDPFFSSRPAGRGRGLGLSRTFRLVEINGGRLGLASTPNVGTTVTIELPQRAPTS